MTAARLIERGYTTGKPDSCELGLPYVATATERCVPCSFTKPGARCLDWPRRWDTLGGTIFVQVASYRDPELVPTILDCMKTAMRPDRLHFCIAWQHGDDERIDAIAGLPNVTVLDIPYRESRGCCWARNLIQQHYAGEEYTLQIDSHTRFAPAWDCECIDMLQQLRFFGHAKPLLTAYLPSYDPANDPAARKHEAWKMNFDKFSADGIPMFRPAVIEGWQDLRQPVKSRFYSAHFAFTAGAFCREVPHDPAIYFSGEEISIAARAFTSGYDLFHPHWPIAWHEYTRKGRPKHWDDHGDWWKENVAAHTRVRRLLGSDDAAAPAEFGIYGLGSVRTLADYETFAGLNFVTKTLMAAAPIPTEAPTLAAVAAVS